MASAEPTPDWHEWLRRWDVQQSGYLPDREQRFSIMLDAVEMLCGTDDLTILDLACGPGSFTSRIHQRFPEAHVVALDFDPVLLGLARDAVGDGGGMITWVEEDLNQDHWPARLGVEQVDAVVSTTALHWLNAERLVATYRHVYDVLRSGGVLLNGDHMAYPHERDAIRGVVEVLKQRRQDHAFDRLGIEDYRAWHQALEDSVPELPWALRRQRFGQRGHGAGPGYDDHVTALRDAGFAEVDTIWQVWDNRVLLGVRGSEDT